MIGAALARLSARLESRHWSGVAASLVLHILVVLLFPLPENEPKPMTFEVALTPPPASQLPTPLSHKLSKQTAKKPPSTRTSRQKRKSDSLDLAWKRERQPRRDAPKVSLPAPQVAARAEEQLRLARPQPVKPTAQAAKPVAEVVEPGLSDPGSGASGQVQAAQPGRDIGVALAVAQSLAMAPGRVSGGLTAQGSAQAASAQGATGGAAGAALANSQQSGGAGVNVAGQGAGSRDGATAQAQSGVESKGVRLSAASHLGGMAALTAAGTTVAAPVAGEAGRANAADAARGGGFAASSGARAAASPQAGAAGGGRSAVAGGAIGEAGVGETRVGEVASAARGGSAAGIASLASSGNPSRSQAPVAGRGAGSTPGQNSRPEGSAPVSSGTTALAASGGASRVGGALSPALAMAPGSTAGGTGGGQKAAARTTPAGAAGGEISAGGEAGGGRTVAASDGEGGRKPALQNTRVAASKLIRPDSEAQALDVLAPSSFCPLPGHQPANQAPQSPNQDPAKAGYAANNPGLFFPVLAMAQGREGKVTVRVEVLPDGHAGKTLLKQSSGSSILDEDARNQLTRLRFTPVQRNGQFVTSWIDVPVTYRLSNK